MSKINRIFLNFFSLEDTKKGVQLLLIAYFDTKNVPYFWPSILKQPKGHKFLRAVLVVLWPYLLTTKLSCLQKNNLGHTIVWSVHPSNEIRVLFWSTPWCLIWNISINLLTCFPLINPDCCFQSSLFFNLHEPFTG